MKVLVAQKCGFCQGVRNAIKLAERTLAERKDVYSLGPIIHNEQAVEKLAADGLKIIENVEQISSGTVLIRSHGATEAQLKRIKRRGLDIVDATCVLVKRLQKIARELNNQGYKVVIIGDENHPEVRAVVGSAHDVLVVAGPSDLRKLTWHRKLGVVCQTTQSPEHFANIVAMIIQQDFVELKIINTLCKEAIKRQNSAVELCKRVDIMFVLGGLNSANTRKLAELCKRHNPQTLHLQNWKQLDTRILCGSRIAGVTAGASTPDWVIREFVQNLETFDTSESGESQCS
jgi:(E)-4-hydroxy-3-methyl-but-2-enyl pyrophosphate reductase